MGERIQAIRGMNDILPEQSFIWRNLEQVFIHCVNLYGYHEIRFPVVESTHLFKRTIGEVTDIVEKEMYTFADRNGDSLTLRPEGTAGCVRACLEHGLLHNQIQKLWYYGPMFRHEKPQKGRYRQFYQFGIEVFGIAGVSIELELLLLCQRFWQVLGLQDVVTLQLNTLGEIAERQAYRQKLIDYFKPHIDLFDEDSRRRLDQNPLRILDSKLPQLQPLIAAAPKLIDVLSPASQQRFQDLCQGLEMLNIPYTINSSLVRGLDYYGHTVFEWVTDKLGSQATVCAGGRFDRLVEQLGGQETPAIGLAMGAERLLLLLETCRNDAIAEPLPLLFMIATDLPAQQRALALAETIRTQYGCSIQVNLSGGGFKSQFKKADKSGARWALILGEDEMAEQTIIIKDLRLVDEQQKKIAQADLLAFLQPYLGENKTCQYI